MSHQINNPVSTPSPMMQWYRDFALYTGYSVAATGGFLFYVGLVTATFAPWKGGNAFFGVTGYLLMTACFLTRFATGLFPFSREFYKRPASPFARLVL